MPNDTAVEMRDLAQGVEQLRANLGNMGLTEAQQKEVAERIDLALGSRNLGELAARVDNIVTNVDAMQKEVETLRQEKATTTFRESDGRVRLRAVDNPMSDLPVYEAAVQAMIHRAQSADGGTIHRNFNLLQDAVRDGEPVTRDSIEAHFDAIEKRVGSLNPLLRHMRDKELGRIEGPGLENPDGFNNASRALTTAAGSAGDAIATIVDSEFLSDVYMTQESLAPWLMTIPMMSKTQDEPILGDSIFNDVVRQDETSARSQGDANVRKITLEAGDLEGLEFISANSLQDSVPDIQGRVTMRLPEVWAEAQDDAVLNADTETTAAQNVNGTAFSGVHGATPKSIGWNGIRSMLDANASLQIQAGADNNSAGALDAANALNAMGRLREVLGRAGLSNFVYVTAMRERFALIHNPTAYRNAAMVGGGSSPLLTGDVPPVWGGPVLSPEAYPLGFQASGRVGSSANNLGAIAIVNRQLTMLGVRLPPFIYTRTPASDDPSGIWIGVRGRIGFGAYGYDQDGNKIAGAIRDGREPLGLLRNISR